MVNLKRIFEDEDLVLIKKEVYLVISNIFLHNRMHGNYTMKLSNVDPMKQ